MKKAILLQARTGSHRLPGKILLTLPHGKTVIEEVYYRLSQVDGKIPLILLIPQDDEYLREICTHYHWDFFCGSHENVRERYRSAARFFDLDLIIRACCDNPCVDPKIIQKSIHKFQSLSKDLFSFSNLPLGCQAECVSRNALESDAVCATAAHREHVTLHIKENPQIFAVHQEDYGDVPHKSAYPPRLTLDTMADYQRLLRIFCHLPPHFDYKDILKLYQKSKEIF